MRTAKRIVVKLGTSVLTDGTPALNRPKMVDIARQCALLHAEGIEIVICSSGAIAAGRETLTHHDAAATLSTKQMLAAVGQLQLMRLWGELFDIYAVGVGQVLLTRADVQSRGRYLNARDTFSALLQHGIVPIVNENDAVATEEIRVGDNDNLSALVATLVEADLLLLLTDQPGLFTADPRSNPDAEMIREVRSLADARAVAGGSVSGLGVGGMATKIDSAEIATRAGVDVIIAAGREPNVIVRLAQGEALGTRFSASGSRLEKRKRWILTAQPDGVLTVDEGAVHALTIQQRSLLPAGIIQQSGQFRRGATVSIVAETGQELARGIVRYGHEALAQIIGKHSAEIEAALGFSYGAAAVHRNDLVLL